jgi:hypothetical protein
MADDHIIMYTGMVDSNGPMVNLVLSGKGTMNVVTKGGVARF